MLNFAKSFFNFPISLDSNIQRYSIENAIKRMGRNHHRSKVIKGSITSEQLKEIFADSSNVMFFRSQGVIKLKLHIFEKNIWYFKIHQNSFRSSVENFNSHF